MAFASAGSDRLLFIGRRQETPEEIKILISSQSVDRSVHAMSIIDEYAMKNCSSERDWSGIRDTRVEKEKKDAILDTFL